MDNHLRNGLLVINVMAKPGDQFASYDLLQAISATGLQFGEMNIFHFYKSAFNKKIPLFSLASATEPGDFDFDRIGDYSCVGLTLFMNMYKVPEPKKTFEIMLKTAEQLADDLVGELWAGPNQPWNDNTLKVYLEKLQRAKMFG